MNRFIDKALAISLIAFSFYWLNKGGAFSIPAAPSGADWQQYAMGANAIWEPDSGASYPAFRRPFYMILLGSLSYIDGVVSAGAFISIVGMLAFLLGVGWWVWIRCGPLYAGLTVLSASLHPLTLEATHYLTPYPLLAGCIALSLGISASQHKTPRVVKAFALGLMLGLAFALDRRSLLMLPFLAWSLGFRRIQITTLLPLVLALATAVAIDFMLCQRIGFRSMSPFEMFESQRTFLFSNKSLERFYPTHAALPLVVNSCDVKWSFTCGWNSLRVNSLAWNDANLIWLWAAAFCLIKSGSRPLMFIWLPLFCMMAFIWSPPRYFFIVGSGIMVSYAYLFFRLLGPKVGFLFFLFFTIGIGNEKREPISPEFPDQLLPVASELREIIPMTSSVLDCTGLDLAVVGQPHWKTKFAAPLDCEKSIMIEPDWLIAKRSPSQGKWILLQSWADVGGQLNLYRRSDF